MAEGWPGTPATPQIHGSSMTDRDLSAELEERVRASAASRTPLCPEGGGTKRFLGRAVQAEALHCADHRGIISYEPTELVITARSGTPLVEVEQTLLESGQMLPFEPPAFGDRATVGGTIAAGLSGPRRPLCGFSPGPDAGRTAPQWQRAKTFVSAARS